MGELSDMLIARDAATPQEDSYGRWLADPTPQNMKTVLDDLDTTINAEIQRFSGPKPLLKSKARALAVKAVKTFNPASGSKLRSWVVTQLQPLSRYNNSLKPIKVPEDAARQSYLVHKTRERLIDETGRDPTDAELADATGVSVKRLRRIQHMTPATVNEPVQSSEDETTADLAVYRSNPAQAAASAVYDALDRRDKMIFDMRTGMHGRRERSGKDIADMLRVSPAFVTQRSNAIAERIAGMAGRML